MSQEFSDHCRGLAQKTMSKVNDPVAQKIHHEYADRMCLARFVGGLVETVGRQIKISKPQTMQEALKIALVVTEAKSHERANEIFFTGTDKLAGRPASASKDRERENAKQAPTRRAQKRTTLKCYECDGRVYFARDCPTRLKRESSSQNSNGNRRASSFLVSVQQAVAEYHSKGQTHCSGKDSGRK